jgi:hypothetical protein
MLSDVLGETGEMLRDILEETADELADLTASRSAPSSAPPRRDSRRELRVPSHSLPPQRLLEAPPIEAELIEELRSHETSQPQDVIEAEIIEDAGRGDMIMRDTALAVRQVTGLPSSAATPTRANAAVPLPPDRRGGFEARIQAGAAAERARVQKGASEERERLAAAVDALRKP